MAHVHNHCRWFVTLLLFVFSQIQGIAADWLCFTAETDDAKFWYETTANWQGGVEDRTFDTDLRYSLDNGETWTQLLENDTVVLKNAGDKAYLKGENPNGFAIYNEIYKYDYWYATFKMEGRIAASGNILSLLYGDEEPNPEEGLEPYCFYELFKDCESLTHAPELPSLNLGYCCYEGMFEGCVNLKEAPALPSHNVLERSYARMFARCTSLTRTPEMVTSPSKGSYAGMFSGCTSLVETPITITAGELESSYSHMFSGCTSLTQALELSIHIKENYTAHYTYDGMYEDCTSLNYIKIKLDCDPNMYMYYTTISTIFSGVEGEGVFYTQCINKAEDDSIASSSETGVRIITPSDMVSRVAPPNFHVISSPIAIFLNPDGTELKRDTILCGEIPDYGEEDPFLDDEHQFVKWDKELTILSEPDYYYYTAEYEAVPGLSNCLRFTAKADSSTFSIKHVMGNNPDIHYSLDGGKTWQPLEENTTVTLRKSGDTAYLKGNNPNGFSTDVSIYSSFVMTGLIAASGSVMSLVDGIGDTTVIPNDYCFTNLFYACQALTEAPELPATTLRDACYESMFVGCINLTQAPSLPANTLAKSCYHDMFNGCVGLTATPDLPATKLAYACYNSMFMYCLNIKDGPDILPATELEELCYERMFSNCTALAKAPELPATKLANYCYFAMFDYCSSIVEAPRLPATELKDMCYADMFHGCSSLAQAPELPAMEVTYGCYSGMFSGCTSLTEAPVLPAINVAMHCYNGMFTSCTGLTKAPELTATRLVDGCYNYMFKDCSNLNYIKVGVMDLDEVEATDDWVRGIKGDGVFEFPCGSKYNIHGDSAVPMNFTIKSSPIVIFQNPDGSVIYQDTVCNVIPECPIVPTFGEGKVFKGWDPEPTLVDNPEKTYYYTAIYEEDNAPGKWLCFTAKEANATMLYSDGGCYVDMQYSDDEGRSWHSWESGKELTFPQEGSKIYVKGDNPYSFSMSERIYVSFRINGRVAASGSVMSLIDGEGVTLEIPNAYCFCGLFYGCTDLVQAPELPATKLTDCCYKSMFCGCSELIQAPALPATELTYECYRNMFAFCDNLKITPKLPASQLEEGCYCQMFRRCLSLEQAPELPAMEMKTNCYQYMFEGCSSMKEAPALPATKLSNSCYHSMFMNCENLTKAPELPADTMQDGCYFDMFSHCLSLQEAPALPALTLADNCYGSMFGYCENLTLAPQLPAMEMKRRCYSYMFTRCFALTEAPELPATELEESCYESMFAQCHSLVRAPELPASELKASCYKGMFYLCSSLNYIKVGVLTLDNDFNATSGWVNRVESPGVFIFPCGTTYNKHGGSEVPTDFEIIGYAYTIDSTITAEGSFTWEGTTYTQSTTWTDSLQTTYGCDSVINYHLEITGGTTIPATFTDKDTSACDLFAFKDVVYTKNASWNDTLKTASGGDSIVIYHLTIHKNTMKDSTITAEESFTWNGTTYTENASWTETLQTVFGCDSIINYHLEITGGTTIPATFTEKDTSACDVLVFKDITYSESTTWNDTLQSISGGDSIIVYHLTIHKSVTKDSTITAEESFTWEGTTYTENASWTETLQTAFGCDSVINYHLRITGGTTIPATFTEKDTSACDVLVFKDITYSESTTWNDTLQAISGGDSIIVYHLTIHKSVTKDSTITAEESFTWNGTTYTENASWTETLQTAFGCDSVINYHLRITGGTTIPATFTEKDTSACDVLVFKDITYSESTTWNDTLQAISGGDSIIVYHMTIHKSVTKDSTITAEESFTWEGTTYTENASWTETLQTAFGCDSVINYHLKITGGTTIPATFTEKDTSACDVFVFKDITYSESTTWNDTLQSISGGDSIIVYHLTIHKSVTKDSTITVEESFTWNGTTYTENASWTETLQTAFGCDSIINYHLKITGGTTIPATFTEKDTSACDVLVFKDITYSENATWNDTLQAISGGDSIIVYHLTIHKSVTKDSTIVAEGSYKWKGTTYTEDAFWSDTMQTIYGCDSIVNYRLIVNEEKDPLQLTVEDELILVLPGGSTQVVYELTGNEGARYEVRHNGQTISSGDVTNDSTFSLTCPPSLDPGIYTATLTMYDGEGTKAEKEFTFNVMRPDDKQKSFYVKVWNDVVICRNGDGQFLTFQWYKGRKKCENATMQYFNDLNLLDGEYMVYVTDKNGKSYFIEPMTYTPIKADYTITAEPNVVKKSEEFTVTVTGVDTGNLSNARIVVYSANGTVENILNEVKEENTMRLKNGEYIIILTVNDGKNADCKVLVK